MSSEQNKEQDGPTENRAPKESREHAGGTPEADKNLLSRRARRGDRAKFEQAMAKVADVEPEEWDRL